MLLVVYASCALSSAACAQGTLGLDLVGGEGGSATMPVGPDTGGSAASGAGASGGGGSAGVAPPPACTYPAGPYGLNQGQVLSPNLKWQGYAVGASSTATIATKDLYDCDGSKQINAILFDMAATWCGACQEEALALPSEMSSSWAADGVKVITLMVQDEAGQPATLATALAWRNAFHLADVAMVVADPTIELVPHSTVMIGLPTNVLVDPRTMRIVSLVQGYAPGDPSIDQLARQNKK
jgi:hypothetical protein